MHGSNHCRKIHRNFEFKTSSLYFAYFCRETSDELNMTLGGKRLYLRRLYLKLYAQEDVSLQAGGHPSPPPSWAMTMIFIYEMLFTMYNIDMYFFFTKRHFEIWERGQGTRWPYTCEDVSSQADGHLVPHPHPPSRHPKKNPQKNT